MTTTDARPRLHRPDAIAVARSFIDQLDGTYEDLKVAGSLRRRLAYAHDIEVVASARREPVTIDLMAEQVVERDLLGEWMADLLDAGIVAKRLDRNGSPRWGPTLKYLTYQGVNVDLFSPEAERMGWILLLRTGPAAFSRQLVVPSRDQYGRPGRTKDGRPGLLPPHLKPVDGWLTDRVSGQRIATPTEQAVFELFRVPYAEPWERV